MCRKCEDAISVYMRLYKCGFPEAIEGLTQERRRMTAFALAMISERHGLDDDGARWHFIAHAAEPPERMQ
jgi:hypothetical protein